MYLGVRRVALLGSTAVVTFGVAAPSYALTEEECIQQAVDTAGTCMDQNGQWTLAPGSDDGTVGFDDVGFGFPVWFAFLFALVVVGGIAATIWRVHTARNLARQAGMDPDVATGMTLLDDNGLSVTYLASSLRTSKPPEPAAGAMPVQPSASDRLTELERLLDGGLITQAEYDERRKAIVDSL